MPTVSPSRSAGAAHHTSVAQPIQSLLRHINQKALSSAVAVETRNRERHLPPVSVYRWWARRTLAVNDALLGAFSRETGYASADIVVADPFAGGGVIPLAAMRRGFSVYAQDLNPWVAKGLATMLALPGKELLQSAREELALSSDPLWRQAYATTFSDGTPATISQTLRVATSRCSNCGYKHKLFPHALVSLTKRKELRAGKAYLACSHGHLFLGSRARLSECPTCGEAVNPRSTHLTDRIVKCPRCSHEESVSVRATSRSWNWEVALVERVDKSRREISEPTAKEVAQASSRSWAPRRTLGPIPTAAETNVLLRHGFKNWEDLYPRRQRVVIERLLTLARSNKNPQLKLALEMAVLGSTEMAGFLSRWDRFYLKSFESMSSHRFNFSTFVAEPNVLGAGLAGRGTVNRRLVSFEKAAEWLAAAGVDLHSRPIFKSSRRRMSQTPATGATIVVGSSERMLMPDRSVNLILTDPPYYDDVQYHELSLPFRTWAKLGKRRNKGEAVKIPHTQELNEHRRYRDVLTTIFKEFHRTLKTDGRLVFSYANREPAAWVNLFAALKATQFRPVAFTIVQSENEHDLTKRKGRSCHLDLILELAASTAAPIEQWRPKPVFRTNEERYLLSVGDAFLKSGSMVNGWEAELVRRLKTEIFVE
ncbi:putative DNA methylase [Bradyrhizobium sp. USDA 4516]